MCCIRIYTSTMLANIFAIQRNPVTYKTMDKYVKFLADMFPTYLVTDFSEQSLIDAANDYPNLFKYTEEPDGLITMHAGERRPNLPYFNYPFPETTLKYYTNITKHFFDELKQPAPP